MRRSWYGDMDERPRPEQENEGWKIGYQQAGKIHLQVLYYP